jgi:hypothetical protein
MPIDIRSLGSKQLRQAALLREKIETLEAQLSAVLTGVAQPSSGPAAASTKTRTKIKGKRKMSPEGKARIAAAQKARWAKINAAKRAK